MGSERHFEHFYFEAQALYISFRRELEHIRPSVSYFETPKLFVVAMLREFTTGKGGVWEPQDGVWPFLMSKWDTFETFRRDKWE